MQRMWAPWRLEYVLDQKPSGCFFCLEAESGADRDKLILYRSAYSVVRLNRYPYCNGHLLVSSRRHTGTLDQLSPAELHDLFAVVALAGSVLQDMVAPDGMNIGINVGAAAGAGVPDHLHVHIVPRWIGDTNFLAVLADVRVMPENVLSTYDRLLPAFSARVEGELP